MIQIALQIPSLVTLILLSCAILGLWCIFIFIFTSTWFAEFGRRLFALGNAEHEWCSLTMANQSGLSKSDLSISKLKLLTEAGLVMVL